MASIKAYKQEQSILSEHPELRELVKDVNAINQTIDKMLRSEYFRGFALPETINKLDVLQKAQYEPEVIKKSLIEIKNTVQNIWAERKEKDFKTSLESRTGITKTKEGYFKTLSFNMPESAVKRAERTGRGLLSEKAVRTLITDDIVMLSRLTKKPESEIIAFLNKWYESVNVSGSQTLTNFVKGVYKGEHAGSGASQTWGSPVVKDKVRNQIFEVEDIEPEYTEEFEESYETESKMDDDLYSLWMKLFD